MALEFEGDAISLSGLTGSKLKSEIIGEYYPFWWNITSGGDLNQHQWDTAIIELNAATGEIYIKETKETILGSAGHAVELKCSRADTNNLKVILVEKDATCYEHLKKVIRRRWPAINVPTAESSIFANHSKVYLMNDELDKAIKKISLLKIGSVLFFFDPLRSVKYQMIEKVAKDRIKTFYQTGTELIIFLFTSDWFIGRDDFVALPEINNESVWTPEQGKTVMEGDALFGDIQWRDQILNNNPIDEREAKLVEIYRKRLHKWFRYVLPLPFNPKRDQIYHLLICSNYEVGIKATKDFYSKWTGNPKYTPDNRMALKEFQKIHSELFEGLIGNQRPPHWKILWETIKYHEEGICDCMCRDLVKIEADQNRRVEYLQWLVDKGYLLTYKAENVWNQPFKQYQLNWGKIKTNLGVEPPKLLEPLSLRLLSLKEINQ